jgi:hypothetical protein
VGDFACVEADDFCAEEDGFFDVVGDGDGGDAEGGQAVSHAGEEDVAHGAVDAAEGFVEEDEFCVGDGEGSGEADDLAFASRELAGHAVEEWAESEEFDGLFDEVRGVGTVEAAASELDVLADGEVREDGCALRCVGESSGVSRGCL